MTDKKGIAESSPNPPQLMNHDELVKEVLRLRSSALPPRYECECSGKNGVHTVECAAKGECAALPPSPPNALPWRDLINEALACGHDNCEGECERAKLARGLIGRFEFMEALTIPIPPSPDLTQPGEGPWRISRDEGDQPIVEEGDPGGYFISLDGATDKQVTAVCAALNWLVRSSSPGSQT